MLLLQALLLLLLSISSMAIPVPAIATGPETSTTEPETLPQRQIFHFYGNGLYAHEYNLQMQEMNARRGLWTRTAVIGEKKVIIVAYQDPHVNGLRMIHPEAVEKVDFDKVFNDDYWHFVPNNQFNELEEKLGKGTLPRGLADQVRLYATHPSPDLDPKSRENTHGLKFKHTQGSDRLDVFVYGEEWESPLYSLKLPV
ncbi:hypothetical protein AX14_000440 [Amanita brunnescens Koide BX004]|nr:hypothetical protein AX14_000440 [Amanita brunnescens Koide BX004]